MATAYLASPKKSKAPLREKQRRASKQARNFYFAWAGSHVSARFSTAPQLMLSQNLVR
jgi:hypothetical protein